MTTTNCPTCGGSDRAMQIAASPELDYMTCKDKWHTGTISPPASLSIEESARLLGGEVVEEVKTIPQAIQHFQNRHKETPPAQDIPSCSSCGGSDQHKFTTCPGAFHVCNLVPAQDAAEKAWQGFRSADPDVRVIEERMGNRAYFIGGFEAGAAARDAELAQLKRELAEHKDALAVMGSLREIKENPSVVISGKTLQKRLEALRPKRGAVEFNEPWEIVVTRWLDIPAVHDRIILCVNALAGISDADVQKLGEGLHDV